MLDVTAAHAGKKRSCLWEHFRARKATRARSCKSCTGVAARDGPPPDRAAALTHGPAATRPHGKVRAPASDAADRRSRPPCWTAPPVQCTCLHSIQAVLVVMGFDFLAWWEQFTCCASKYFVQKLIGTIHLQDRRLACCSPQYTMMTSMQVVCCSHRAVALSCLACKK